MSATNPDQRPLPTGWITQYDDKCVCVPSDADRARAPLTRHLASLTPVTKLGRAFILRLIPTTDYRYLSRFYIDTKANPPTPSWTHPLGPPPANTSQSESLTPHKQTSYSSVSSGAAGTYSSAPKESKNPDTRPLPTGWITEYDERHVQMPYYPIRLPLFFRSHTDY